MAAQKDNAALRENTRQKLYKNEREYRAAKYIDAWSRIPKIGAGLAELPLEEAQNVAINLNQQASFMSRLNEAQLWGQDVQGLPTHNLPQTHKHSSCRNGVRRSGQAHRNAHPSFG
jgi:hypothetical protein